MFVLEHKWFFCFEDIISGKSHNYFPQTKLQEGSVFTPVCQSFCLQGGVSQHAVGVYTPRQTPPGRSLLARHPPVKPPQADIPWADTPRQTPSRADTPPPRDGH